MSWPNKVVVITWRGVKLLNEYSGGNLRRTYLTEKIIRYLAPSIITEVTIEQVDSNASRAFAFGGRVLETVGLRSIAAFFREFRFYWVDCDVLRRITGDASLLVVDHVRSVVMLSRCRVRVPSIVILHDFHREFPYGTGRLVSALSRYVMDGLIYEYLNDTAKLVITASVRDRLMYSEHVSDIGKLLVYPNLYYPDRKVMLNKDSEKLVINIVTPKVSTKVLTDLVSLMIRRIPNVEVRGISAPRVPNMRNYGTIESREEYLSLLAEGHIGINITNAKTQPGSNVKRYDYAIAGNVPFNYMVNSTGEPLPHEYAFTDKYDLVAKVESLDITTLVKYGIENAEYTYNKSIEYDNALRNALSGLMNELLRG